MVELCNSRVLQKWSSNGGLRIAYKCINRGKPDIELTSDASGLGWGATNDSTQTGGRWNHVEMANTLPRVTGSIFCFEIIL